MPLRWIFQRWRVRSLWCSIDTVGQFSQARGGRGNVGYHTAAHHCRNGVAREVLGVWQLEWRWALKKQSTRWVESEWMQLNSDHPPKKKRRKKSVSPIEKQEQVHKSRYEGTYWIRWLEWTFPVLVLEEKLLMLVGCPWIQGLDAWVGWYYWKKKKDTEKLIQKQIRHLSNRK